MGIESIKYYDICDDCLHKSYCDMAQFGGHNPHITACYHFTQSKHTNADRVRAMTDEELAELVCDHACMLCPIEGCEGRMEEGREKCKQRWLEWLKQEVDNG